MDEIITSGSVTTVPYPGFAVQDRTIDTGGNKDDKVDNTEEEEGKEEQMVRMFAVYRVDNEDQEFKFLHMFSTIESCKKWREVRLALDKAKETYNLDVPIPTAVEGRPHGTKKARVVRDVAPAAERLQASIEQCIADVKSSTVRREEKSDVRWSVLMIDVSAKKTNTGLGFLMRPDTLTMDEQVKAWYLMQRNLILSHIPAPAAITAATTTAAPMTMPSPSIETTPPTMTPTSPVI
ncbi:putative methionyl-tRNA synthetase [Hordeum vulgare]|nr:putative methionyl-tRNA synthetase [Hordeum vulgare]